MKNSYQTNEPDTYNPTRKAVSTPENYCPICAIRVGLDQSGHRCSKRAYDARDSGNKENYVSPPRSLTARLNLGFALLSDDDLVDKNEE